MATPDAILYSERPEWSDVVPLEQYEGVNPLAPIMYAEEYKDATNYFRAIVKSGERSERALELTERVIRMNPAHYSAWQYRYETLIALNKPLHEELRYMDPIAVKHLKNYQVWHHRRLLITHLSQSIVSDDEDTEPLKDAETTKLLQEELAFLAQSLQADTKNYHTWSYRQWLLSYFNPDDSTMTWENELDWTERMISEDVRNNSAWHHRFFLIWSRAGGIGAGDKDRIIRREVIYTKHQISLAPNNPSAWNYLRGVLDRNAVPYASVKEFARLYVDVSEDPSARRDIVDVENPPPGPDAELPAVQAMEFMADIYERAESASDKSKAVELWKQLADTYDVVRKKYWEFRIRDGGLLDVHLPL